MLALEVSADIILPHFLHVLLALNQNIFLCFFLRHFWRTAFKMESIMSCKYWKTSQALPGEGNLPFSFTGLGLFDLPRESTKNFVVLMHFISFYYLLQTFIFDRVRAF